MDFDFKAFIGDNLDAAGVIGGYVSISIISVTLITFFSSKRLKKSNKNIPKWAHPIMGALLGVIPGCGGTIVASSLYKNKKISFGGLLSAFITTLGEGSFVLLGASDEADVTANIKAFIIVNIVGFVLGIIAGSIVDVLGIKGNLNKTSTSSTAHQISHQKNHPFARIFVEKIGFILLLSIALFLAPGSIMALWGAGITGIEQLTVWACTALTLISIAYYLTHRFVLKEACHMDKHSNIKEALLDAVTDTSMVISYVFGGLIVANFLIDIVVGPDEFNAWMSSSAKLVVLLSALIGATPGCGGMIAVAVAYVSIPSFPIAALIAGSIATSGDGIFPLLAENKKDALFITLYSLIIALFAGYIALAVGVQL